MVYLCKLETMSSATAPVTSSGPDGEIPSEEDEHQPEGGEEEGGREGEASSWLSPSLSPAHLASRSRLVLVRQPQSPSVFSHKQHPLNSINKVSEENIGYITVLYSTFRNLSVCLNLE